ncbi:hypothetical protein SAY87_020813 [Trapa incisa]|uniref:Uncharacterized protein n=1 Tax=Trapa incisa TaxID=236973 RepID=A0AAN7PUU2_9MYRT|nr:hypothetical protein SAY87_020813 [Trapa incisa]
MVNGDGLIGPKRSLVLALCFPEQRWSTVADMVQARERRSFPYMACLVYKEFKCSSVCVCTYLKQEDGEDEEEKDQQLLLLHLGHEHRRRESAPEKITVRRRNREVDVLLAVLTARETIV